MSIYAILASIPHNPHYLNRYISFIESCPKVNEGFEGYTEKHHICPRSLFPEYKSFAKNPWNLAVLTARQHFIAHWILWKAYPENKSMLFAFMCMHNKDCNKLNSRTYELLREEYSKATSMLAKERVVNGTHHWLGPENNKKRIDKGTHNFLDSEYQKNVQKKRIENGTHHFLGGEIQRKRVEDGTHHFLGGEMVRKRVEAGTHHFLGGEIQRKRVEDGTHNLLAGDIQREAQRKRVKDGTHPFLGGEIQKRAQLKRSAEGTHHMHSSVACINREGIRVLVSKDVYYSQTGPIEEREYVHFGTKEAKTRKQKDVR